MQQDTNDPNDMNEWTLTPEERAWEIAQNIKSIEAVPLAVWDALDYGAETLSWALSWARKGYDCYAYKGFGEYGVWNVWFDHQRIELGREGSAPAAAAETTPATAEGGES